MNNYCFTDTVGDLSDVIDGPVMYYDGYSDELSQNLLERMGRMMILVLYWMMF